MFKIRYLKRYLAKKYKVKQLTILIFENKKNG